MATRYRYATTLCGTTGAGEPGEMDVEVSFVVTWGRAEAAPSYSHGGLPADPDEIDDVRVELIDGARGPFDQEVEAAILQEIALSERHYEAMLEEAVQREAAWAE